MGSSFCTLLETLHTALYFLLLAAFFIRKLLFFRHSDLFRPLIPKHSQKVDGYTTESVDIMNRNWWSNKNGIGGRITPDYAGIKVPIVSLGSMEVTSEPLVGMALDAGISHIATSRYYQRGKVAKFVGKLIKNYRREDIILATGIDPYPPPWKEGYYSKDTDIVRFERDFDSNLKSMSRTGDGGCKHVNVNVTHDPSSYFEPFIFL
jgi:hypothetical protein